MTNSGKSKCYRKKPIIIEAVQWDGTWTGLREIERAFPNIDSKLKDADYHVDRNEVYRWRIGTLEGGHDVSKGDWIIKGIKGEFYPCKPDIFEKTYEPAGSPDSTVPAPSEVKQTRTQRINEYNTLKPQNRPH